MKTATSTMVWLDGASILNNDGCHEMKEIKYAVLLWPGNATRLVLVLRRIGRFSRVGDAVKC